MLDLVPLGMALYSPHHAPDAPLEWRIDGRWVRLNVTTDPATLAEQARGILGYLDRVCGVDDPALAGRLEGVRAIYGLTAEASLDPSRARARCWDLARKLDALVFDRGAFYAGTGEVLAAPRAPEDSGLADADVDQEDLDRDDTADLPPAPPSATRTAARARVLAGLGVRAQIEVLADHDEGCRRLDALRTWIVAQGLEAELEDDERAALFGSPVGSMPRQARIDSLWRFEGAALLTWALGLLALPLHDTVVDVQTLLDALGVCRPTPPGIARPRLRASEEILAMRERIFSIHWRLVDYRLRPVALDFPDVARRSMLGLVTDPEMLAGTDLGVRGRPIADADAGDIGLAGSIARERHQAANWLVGDGSGPRYSDVGTDT